MVIGIQFSVLVSGLVCGFDFDGSMQSQCASSTPEPRALVSVAGSAKLRSLNCQIVSMVQFSGQVVDTQWCSKKIWRKKCNLVQKRCNFRKAEWKTEATPHPCPHPQPLSHPMGEDSAGLSPSEAEWVGLFVAMVQFSGQVVDTHGVS